MPEPVPLSPAETVYFRATEFSREKSLLDSAALVHSEDKVRATDLAVALLAAAVLADEKAGAIRLEVGQKKALFGLRKKEALFLRPAQPAAFPAPSPETRVAEAARAAQGDVVEVVRAWLGEDSPTPYHAVISRVEEGLATRGLFEVEEVRHLKVFRAQRYKAPESTRQLAGAVRAEEAKALLEAARRERPEVWALLESGIRDGIKSRTEQSDSGPD